MMRRTCTVQVVTSTSGQTADMGQENYVVAYWRCSP